MASADSVCPQEQFDIDDALTYRTDGPVNLHRLFSLFDLKSSYDLKHRSFTPAVHEIPEEPELFFEAIRKKDILLHHPYESFSTVIDFIRMAANDPAIGIANALPNGGRFGRSTGAISAAEGGKEVTVLVELKARETRLPI